jgi:hypothetical protein
MNSVLRRRGLLAVVLAAMVFALLAMPALALADTGDADNPVTPGSVPWSHDVTGSLVATVDAGVTYYEHWCEIPMTRGQTARFTLRSLDADALLSVMSKTLVPAGFVCSKTVGTGVQALTFMAPRTGSYYLVLDGSSVSTFTLNSAIAPTTKYKMSGFTAPKSKKKNAKFAVSVKLSRAYNSLGSPVQFQVQRKLGKKWKSYSTAVGSAGLVAYPVKYSAKVKIKKKGTFRIRAKFSDAAHSKARYTAWKTIKIK